MVTSKKTWLTDLYSVQCILCHFLAQDTCRGIRRRVQAVCDEAATNWRTVEETHCIKVILARHVATRWCLN